MGQYQQWMHYREVDRLLQEQLAQLEAEFTRLLQTAPEQTQYACLSDNSILIALSAYQREEPQGRQTAESLPPSTPRKEPAGSPTSNVVSTSIPPDGDSQVKTTGAISPALRSWGEFPDVIDGATPELSVSLAERALPAIPHDGLALLPEDMNAFIEEFTPTDPQIELPWWLQNIAATAGVNQSNGLIDLQSARTNRLVQRWLERWGRLPASPRQHGE